MRSRRLLVVLLVPVLAACGGPKGSRERQAGVPDTSGPAVTTRHTGYQADTLAVYLNPFFAPLRDALFASNRGETARAAAALAEARGAWRTLAGRPPGDYLRDADWSPRRDAIENALAAAEAGLGQGNPRAAHETLERVRHELSDLNRGIGVIGWPDLLLAFHDPMEKLAEAESVTELRSQVVACRLALARLAGFHEQAWSEAERNRVEDGLRTFAVQLDSLEISLGEGDSVRPARPYVAALRRAFVDLYLTARY